MRGALTDKRRAFGVHSSQGAHGAGRLVQSSSLERTVAPITNPKEQVSTDNLDLLLTDLPPHIRHALNRHGRNESLIEVVLDLARPPEAPYPGEAARVLADDLAKRVIVVDTSNEIAGDGDVPHPGIGRARRMQVPDPEHQHQVMIEAVENHMPEVIVIDEIGTAQEALAARTIAERGVQLIATVHGNTLENLMINPTLSDMVGGIQPVTLSDEE